MALQRLLKTKLFTILLGERGYIESHKLNHLWFIWNLLMIVHFNAKYYVYIFQLLLKITFFTWCFRNYQALCMTNASGYLASLGENLRKMFLCIHIYIIYSRFIYIDIFIPTPFLNEQINKSKSWKSARYSRNFSKNFDRLTLGISRVNVHVQCFIVQYRVKDLCLQVPIVASHA